MTQEKRIRLVGGIGSPYTQKMVALLRYRRIPHSPIWGEPDRVCEQLGIPLPRPVLMPTFFIESDEGVKAAVDSTPIIRNLEQEYQGRSVIPDDPALAFIDYLIEDFADEWGTRYMFHFRWHFEADADNAGTLLPLHYDLSMSAEKLQNDKDTFSNRQITRLYVVGSNEITAPIIDKSYRRFLSAMEDHICQQRFILGGRPASGDFGLFGQLSQLVGVDPTPRKIAHEISPRTVAWVDLMYDQTALEPAAEDWVSLEDQPDTLKALLAECGRTYAIAQVANAKAVKAGEENWECQIDGAKWVQPTFPYQAKCLKNSVELYQALSSEDRARVDRFLDGTGVETMLHATI